MAQKKAFVRYAQNKAVPGSLIVRTKAPKVGTWKEVPYDICCGGGGCVQLYGFSYRVSTGEVDVWKTVYSECDIQNINPLANPQDIIGCKVYTDSQGTIFLLP